MAKSTGIMLTATAIGMGNEFVQGKGINFRMGIAGLGAALFLTGIEAVNETAGVGLAVLAMVTVLLTPFQGRSPAQEVLALIGNKSQTIPGVTTPKVTGPSSSNPQPGNPFSPGISIQ